MNKTKVSLVLGSGGARGYAHIGVIEELEKQGFEIVSISGTSMGALVGGLYACGQLDAYKEWVLNLDRVDVASFLDVAWTTDGGLIKGEKIFDTLAEMTGKKQIEALPIKFTAVATDITKKKEVWFQQGDLLEAIRASIAIPSFFTPVKKGNSILVDGGVLNPLPVAPTMSDMSDMVIAVNLYADKPAIKSSQADQSEEKYRGIKEKIIKVFDKIRGNDLPTVTTLDILDKTLDTMQDALTRYRLGAYKADQMIDISMEVCHTFDFHKADHVIETGRVEARAFAEAYKSRKKEESHEP
ncbi:MAG TPA: patatin [Epsilonproteobacteria bacterium]|nr:patatin [Campylobacterota bacterium]